MEWFVEEYNGAALKIAVKKKIVEKLSKFQKIEIYETVSFGKMLVLDGKIQLTEKDEAFYHEMLVHVPLISHKDPKKVLIVGGGDGGSLREVLKHDPEEAVLVEIDGEVIELSKKYLGIDGGAFEDNRVSVLVEDGYEFLKESKEKFDVIIVDGTDPNPFSMRISEEEFYGLSNKKCDIFTTQSQSPFAQRDYFKQVVRSLKKSFESFKIYLGFVPTYPLGLWSYAIAKNFELDLDVVKERFESRELKTKYYSPEVHVASFSLPRWIEKLIEEA
ncbi:spermidine synthase [Ferroglobus placidus DSM 10642]|uniref:Polyamine aminopropyltransferase n=1 Tax=Ferroglobus placidus (strain DSM 10642 / AEDII12DO) TaxID=589924 RepID=D3S2F6_FERPA|nr:spermidine synthase [Ferroglobus placidus]ADC64486.1 spermidine synthase [Ferroglobus placidus DSM 10642]